MHLQTCLIDLQKNKVCLLLFKQDDESKSDLSAALAFVSTLTNYHSVQSPFGCTQTESAASAVKR